MKSHSNAEMNKSTTHFNINLNGLSPQRSAQSVLLISNIIWGITPIFLEVVLAYLTPLHTTVLRFGVAVLVLTFFLFFFKGRNGFSLLSAKTCILLGWLDALGYLAAAVGQDMTTPGLSTLLSSFYVFIVPLIAWKLEGTRLDWKIGIIGFASLVGVFLISFNGDWGNFANSSMSGVLVLMFSAVMWGFYTVISGKFLDVSKSENKRADLLSFTYSSLFHTFIALMFLSIATEGLSFSIPIGLIPYLLFVGIFPTIVALGLWNWAIGRLGSISTSFFQLLQIIVPFILEFVFFQQLYSAWIYSGIILILISAFWIGGGNTTKEQLDEKEMVTVLSDESLGSVSSYVEALRKYREKVSAMNTKCY